MADDIQPGDVVVCVDDSPPRYGRSDFRLHKGRIYRVTDAFLAPNYDPVVLVNGEQLHHLEGGRVTGWLATRFRKLPPADETFTADLKARIRRHDRVSA